MFLQLVHVLAKSRVDWLEQIERLTSSKIEVFKNEVLKLESSKIEVLKIQSVKKLKASQLKNWGLQKIKVVQLHE